MKKNPLISVIINCHNGEKYLKNCIKSIISQSYKNWEIIFFDNASKDNSKKILKSFRDKRIKYFFSNKILKLYDARNKAIKKSSGNYISFLDTDDYWKRDFLKEHLNFFFRYKNADVIVSKYLIYNEINKTSNISFLGKLPYFVKIQHLLNNYFIGILAVMFKKKIFKTKSFNKKYQIIGDFAFFLSISSKYKIKSLNSILAVYRIHKKNFSKINYKIYIYEIIDWIKKNSSLRKKHNFIKIYSLILKLCLKFFFQCIYKVLKLGM